MYFLIYLARCVHVHDLIKHRFWFLMYIFIKMSCFDSDFRVSFIFYILKSPQWAQWTTSSVLRSSLPSGKPRRKRKKKPFSSWIKWEKSQKETEFIYFNTLWIHYSRFNDRPPFVLAHETAPTRIMTFISPLVPPLQVLSSFPTFWWPSLVACRSSTWSWRWGSTTEPEPYPYGSTSAPFSKVRPSQMFRLKIKFTAGFFHSVSLLVFRYRIRHLHHRSVRVLLLQHHHRLGPLLLLLLLLHHPAVDKLRQRVEYPRLHQLFWRRQRHLDEFLQVSGRGILHVSACKCELQKPHI